MNGYAHKWYRFSGSEVWLVPAADADCGVIESAGHFTVEPYRIMASLGPPVDWIDFTIENWDRL